MRMRRWKSRIRFAATFLKLAMRREGNRIVEARFLCRGCTTAIACASYLTEQLLALPVAAWKSVSADSISSALGDLPPATRHGAQLAADALRAIERRLTSAKLMLAKLTCGPQLTPFAFGESDSEISFNRSSEAASFTFRTHPSSSVSTTATSDAAAPRVRAPVSSGASQQGGKKVCESKNHRMAAPVL